MIFFIFCTSLLFGLAFVTKRRLGPLGLALAAGLVLSMHWASTLTPFLEKQGVVSVVPPLGSIVAMALVLTPAIIVLLMGGPTYTKAWQRVIGGVVFAVLAILFMLEPLGTALRLEGQGAAIYSFLVKYQSILIVVGIVAAIVDTILTRKLGGRSKKADHH